MVNFQINDSYIHQQKKVTENNKDYDRNTNNINNATWVLLDANIANQPSNGYGHKFTQSGVINISCLDENTSIGFHYTGGLYGATTTFQIDDIVLKGK